MTTNKLSILGAKAIKSTSRYLEERRKMLNKLAIEKSENEAKYQQSLKESQNFDKLLNFYDCLRKDIQNNTSEQK